MIEGARYFFRRLASVLLVVSALSVFFSCSDDIDIQEPENIETAGSFVRVLEDRTVTRDDFADMIGDLVPGLGILKGLVSVLIGKDVHVTEIVYTTAGPDGELLEASGIVAYPEGLKSYEYILSIQHGTCDIAEAPTNVTFPAELSPVFTENTVVVMADYIGYGYSETKDLQHPYLHNELTGSTCADMLEASEEYLALRENGVPWCNGRGIRLMGYSQGGAATVSTMMELERRGYGSRIEKVTAGAGPYDLEGFFRLLCENDDEPLSMSGFVPFVLRGLAYGDRLELSPEKVYAPEIISGALVDKFSNTQLSKWHGMIGHDIRKILNQDFFVTPGWNGNSDVASMMASLKKNSIVNCPVPANVSKLELYHSPSDDTVPYACSRTLSDRWGCSLADLTVRDDHVKAGIEFVLRYMGLWDKVKFLFI